MIGVDGNRTTRIYQDNWSVCVSPEILDQQIFAVSGSEAKGVAWPNFVVSCIVSIKINYFRPDKETGFLTNSQLNSHR